MIRNIAAALALMCLGGVLAIGFLRWLGTPVRLSEEEIRTRYVVEYTKSEQAKYGVSCVKLNTNLREFLDNRVSPLLAKRQTGKDWDKYVTGELKQELDKYRRYIQVCGRLYTAGKDGTLNQLQSLHFISEIEKDFAIMEIMLQIGAPSQKCDADCLDRFFSELKDRHTSVVKRLQSDTTNSK